jgi:hypothetical protein
MTAPDALRDLDRRIAELRGWTECDVKPSGGAWHDPAGRCGVLMPAYTTSWQHAGPLLEEMAADEDVELHVTLSGIFHVRVIFPFGPADAYYDRFDPEAVARAWLAWQEARACEKP